MSANGPVPFSQIEAFLIWASSSLSPLFIFLVQTKVKVLSKILVLPLFCSQLHASSHLLVSSGVCLTYLISFTERKHRKVTQNLFLCREQQDNHRP